MSPEPTMTTAACCSGACGGGVNRGGGKRSRQAVAIGFDDRELSRLPIGEFFGQMNREGPRRARGLRIGTDIAPPAELGLRDEFPVYQHVKRALSGVLA